MKRLPLKITYLWLFVFMALPLFLVVKLSFSSIATAIPPYTPTFSIGDDYWSKIKEFSFANYELLFSDSIYLNALLTSLKLAFISTTIIAVFGYAIAFALAEQSEKHRTFLLTLIIIPFWTSFLIRVYAWIGILKTDGYLQQFFPFLPTYLNTTTGVIIGMVYSYLPFMILPLYANLSKQDGSLKEAARDLGASSVYTFLKITLPLSFPALLAGSLICFIPIMGEIIIPDMLGGKELLNLGKIIWIEFFNNRDWALASSLSLLLLLLILTPFLVWQKMKGREA